jgi:hypothetical protein
MSLFLYYGEQAAYSAIAPDAPTLIDYDVCQFTYPVSGSLSPTSGGVLYASGFVGIIVGFQVISTNRVITTRFDPEVYNVPTSGGVIKYFGSNNLRLSNGFKFTRTFGLGKYSENDAIYNYRPSFSIETTTSKHRVSDTDIINALKSNGTFLYDDCSTGYAYMVMMENEALGNRDDKVKYDLEFNVGTNKRFNI